MQMDQITQQNAALVEQATAASQAMTGHAQQLTGLMENYRIDSALTAPDDPTLRAVA